jgi:hypothetical protein
LSNGPISFTGSSWTQNNQYSFTLSKAANLRIALRRRWGSYIDTELKEEEHIFGYMLFRSQEGETEISCLKLEALVHKRKSTDEGGCLLDCSLEKGTYILIPYSHSVSQQYMQLFNLDILLEREDLISLNKSRMSDYFYHSESANGDKIIQRLQAKVKHERPKF